MTTDQINELKEAQEKAMKGPFEYWDKKDNDLIVGECAKKGEGKLIAGLAGLTSKKKEFKLIVLLLNNAADLIQAAEENVRLREALKTASAFIKKVGNDEHYHDCICECGPGVDCDCTYEEDRKLALSQP